jgi:transposase InsO family protein
VGAIKGQWLGEEKKREIVVLIEDARGRSGVSITRACMMWMIGRRRVVRWQRRWRQGQGLSNGKPGSPHPVHRLLESEKEAVLEMAKKEEYADLAHRVLTVTAWDRGLFFLSFSSVYRILFSARLMVMRGMQRVHNGRSLPPVRKELTGPNQRWCWDISYLPTQEKGLFLYLYVLLDEYSRKVIQYRVSWHQRAEEARDLLEGGLAAENILDVPEEDRPEVINDRGGQMKAKSIKRLFEDHGMPQKFARPRTPNDNAFVESLFGTVKTAPEYPGWFLDQEEAMGYFDRYFPWYNTQHVHSGIEYVTPEQCHRGLRESIVARRKRHLKNNRQVRKEANRLNQAQVQNQRSVLLPAFIQPLPCSVIDL